jgi:riboflavin kinase/FMN adenylyltransferase
MRVLGSGVRPEKGCVVTIGAFDGVHRGHQALIDEVRKRADAIDAASAVVTFDCHPASVVRPESAPQLLTDLDQKLELLAATGIDYVLVVPFDRERANENAEDFVEDILINRLNARMVVVGYDFHFGKDRRGNVHFLRDAGKELDFEVVSFDPVRLHDEDIVSSTAIRALLADGDVVRAHSMLGRPHEVRGLVVMGDGRGRELGFPTANVHVPTQIAIPADGVYGGEYLLADGSVRKTAISVGTRPQFYEDGITLVEAYVLDFDGDLYGQHAQVRFVHRVRGQEKFANVDELIVQMATDVESVRTYSGLE